MKKSEFKEFIMEKVFRLDVGQKIIFKLTSDGYEIFIHRISEEDVFIYVPSSFIWEAIKIDLANVEKEEVWDMVEIFIERFCGLSSECYDEDEVILVTNPHFLN